MDLLDSGIFKSLCLVLDIVWILVNCGCLFFLWPMHLRRTLILDEEQRLYQPYGIPKVPFERRHWLEPTPHNFLLLEFNPYDGTIFLHAGKFVDYLVLYHTESKHPVFC